MCIIKIIRNHNIYGDKMISFFIKIIFSTIIIYVTYSFFHKKEIKVLEIITLLFLFHIGILSIYLNINMFIMLLSSLLIISIYYFYKYMETKEIIQKLPKDIILINRGIVNFHELVSSGYDYDEFIYELKKRGIKNFDDIDYCVKKNNDLIIFQKNSIKNYPISLIIDGYILKDNLFSIRKNLDWLERKIEENNLNINNINYAYYKKNQIYFVTNE